MPTSAVGAGAGAGAAAVGDMLHSCTEFHCVSLTPPH